MLPRSPPGSACRAGGICAASCRSDKPPAAEAGAPEAPPQPPLLPPSP